MNIEIANRLYEYRKQNNLSQEELAQQIGVSRQAVSKWERAESSPDTDNLIELAKLYGVSLDELLFTNEPTRKGEKEEDKSKDYVNIGLGGIHVKDGEDEVHITWKEGLRIMSGEGEDDVRVSWKDGIRVVTDGEVEFDSEEWAKKVRRKWYLHLPVGLLATAAFLYLGIWQNLWHVAWLVFLVVPVFYQLLKMTEAYGLRRKLDNFPMVWLCIAAYLYSGFFHDLWHPAWVIFLAVPIYYSLVALIPKKKKD
jgi:transcriptional regulator with XRE-family HTH domain